MKYKLISYNTKALPYGRYEIVSRFLYADGIEIGPEATEQEALTTLRDAGYIGTWPWTRIDMAGDSKTIYLEDQDNRPAGCLEPDDDDSDLEALAWKIDRLARTMDPFGWRGVYAADMAGVTLEDRLQFLRELDLEELDPEDRQTAEGLLQEAQGLEREDRHD